MPSLAEHQRTMLNLVRGRAVPAPDDSYFSRVAGSRELELLREISLWWCALGIKGSCPWTSRLLDGFGLFDASVEAFHLEEDVSPYVEKAGRQFLTWLCRHSHGLPVSLAGFELALLAMRRGETDEFIVDWDRNPNTVMIALRSRDEIPPTETGCVYRLRLSRSLPELMRCERIDIEQLADSQNDLSL